MIGAPMGDEGLLAVVGRLLAHGKLAGEIIGHVPQEGEDRGQALLREVVVVERGEARQEVGEAPQGASARP